MKIVFNREIHGEQIECIAEGELTVMLNGRQLPVASIEYLVQYGIGRALNDAGAASADTPTEERAAAMQKRIAKLFDGTMRAGTGGGARLTDVERVARSLAETALRAKYPTAAAAAIKTAAVKNAHKFHDAAKKQLANVAKLSIDDLEM